jgi:hypothetical protein
MSKHLHNIQERECKICYNVYNMIEFDTCPMCEEMHELSKEFLMTTDDENIDMDYSNLISSRIL